jgi:hypothetical protein
MSDELRTELEAAYESYHDALFAGNATSFMDAAILPPHLSGEQFLARFDDFASDELASGPDLADRQFVTLKTVGDDLAGYYSLWRPQDDLDTACVAMTAFRRTPEGWKVVVGGTTVNFTPKPGEDIQATAMQIIESDEDMRLQSTDADAMPVDGDDAPAGNTSTALQAALECMAYDCEMSIAINGVPLRFRGGQSRSQLLQTVREGASPEDPNVLRVGRNDVVMAYRRKADGPPASLEIHLQSGPCLRMEPARAEGRLSGSFVISPSPPEGSQPDEMSCVVVTDADDLLEGLADLSPDPDEP